MTLVNGGVSVGLYWRLEESSRKDLYIEELSTSQLSAYSGQAGDMGHCNLGHLLSNVSEVSCACKLEVLYHALLHYPSKKIACVKFLNIFIHLLTTDSFKTCCLSWNWNLLYSFLCTWELVPKKRWVDIILTLRNKNQEVIIQYGKVCSSLVFLFLFFLSFLPLLPPHFGVAHSSV